MRQEISSDNWIWNCCKVAIPSKVSTKVKIEGKKFFTVSYTYQITTLLIKTNYQPHEIRYRFEVLKT